MQKVFITGGNGNLGRLFARQLQQRQVAVVRFDLPDSSHAKSGDKEVIESGDIRDFDRIYELLKVHKPDAICHLASLLSGSSEQDLAASFEINASASFHLMQAAVRHGIERFLFASTAATYNGVDDNPMPEDYPQWPGSMYGATKVAVERLGYYFKIKHGLDFRCVRFPLVISPFAPTSAVSAYPSHAILSASRGQHFVFPVEPETGVSTMALEDVINALDRFIAVPPSSNRRPAYNVDSYYLTARMVADTLSRRFPGFSYEFKPEPQVEALIKSWPDRVDNFPAAEDWGWQPSYNFEQSIERLLAMTEES